MNVFGEIPASARKRMVSGAKRIQLVFRERGSIGKGLPNVFLFTVGKVLHDLGGTPAQW